MKINIDTFTTNKPSMCLEAENAAESIYLKYLADKMLKNKVNFHEWDDMEGKSGITIQVNKKE